MKRLVLSCVLFSLVSLPLVPAQAGVKATPKATVTSTPKATCAYTSGAGRTPTKIGIPNANLPHVNHTLILKTNCGDIQILEDGVRAPLTSIAMNYLAQQKYFDNTPCYRLVTAGIFVLQCGDPTGSGSGGPNWSIPYENYPAYAPNNFPEGTVAMAEARPLDDGRPYPTSSFFLVYKDSTLGYSTYPTKIGNVTVYYSIWGRITKGLDVVKAIAAAGSDNSRGDGDGAPNQKTMILSAQVK